MEELILADKVARELLDKAGKVTQSNYKDYSVHSLVCAVDDLLIVVEGLNEDIKDLEQDIEDNYRPVSRAEEINYNYHDFL